MEQAAILFRMEINMKDNTEITRLVELEYNILWKEITWLQFIRKAAQMEQEFFIMTTAKDCRVCL